MLNYNTLFETELKKIVRNEIDRLTEILVLGHAVEDYSKYQNILGQIASLSRIDEMCDEVQTILSQR